jgi:hypothetical protein
MLSLPLGLLIDAAARNAANAFSVRPAAISNNYASARGGCANAVQQKIRSSNKQMHVRKATLRE